MKSAKCNVSSEAALGEYFSMRMPEIPAGTQKMLFCYRLWSAINFCVIVSSSGQRLVLMRQSKMK